MSTTDEQQGFKTEALDQWADPETFAVEVDHVAAYAAATNDDHPQHASGELAPPVYAVIAAFHSWAPIAGEVIPPELLMRVVHGEQDVHLHKPIRPGMTLQTRSAVTGFAPRSSGATVIVKAETSDGDGELVCEQYITTFVRGGQLAEGSGASKPEHAFPEQVRSAETVGTVSQTFDADQTFRYSEASGDPMPIHLDDEMAKAMGLPGIIIHGLCTMAFVSRAVIATACADDPARLKRLAVRFSKVVQPEETITTQIWKADERDGRDVFVFETTSEAGAVVIKDGLAEVTSSEGQSLR